MHDTTAWMKRSWSIQLQIYSSAFPNGFSVFSTPAPFEASPEEAQRQLDDLRNKIASICVSRVQADPLIAYERQAGGEPIHRFSYWTYNDAHVPKAQEQRYFRAVVDQAVIPAEVIRTSVVRVSLLEEF